MRFRVKWNYWWAHELTEDQRRDMARHQRLHLIQAKVRGGQVDNADELEEQFENFIKGGQPKWPLIDTRLLVLEQVEVPNG